MKLKSWRRQLEKPRDIKIQGRHVVVCFVSVPRHCAGVHSDERTSIRAFSFVTEQEAERQVGLETRVLYRPCRRKEKPRGGTSPGWRCWASLVLPFFFFL